jgi:Holliday junction DNA helicase RuvA
MYEYIQGKIEEKSPNALVIDVNGIGYALDIPSSTFDRLGAVGSEARVLVHFHVREDTQKLFGFATRAERDVFRQLLSVSQIGPRAALTVLSKVSIGELCKAVATGDSSRLKTIHGIGPKTAQRLVVELKGKLSYESAGGDPEASRGGDGQRGAEGVDREAYAAMISLGYSEAQVVRALYRVSETIPDDSPVEEWIRRALQVI